MIKTLYGIAHGKTIELDEDLGLAEGQAVEVQVKVIQPTKVWGEGILRSAGGWAGYPDLDGIMEQIHEERKRDRRSQELE